MKLSDKTVVVCDNGLFVEFASVLARTFGKVYYHCASGNAYRKMTRGMVGLGIEGLEILEDDIFEIDPDKVDLFCFPDVNFGYLQEDLRNRGFRVWGSGMGELMENDRVGMKKDMAKHGLPVGPYEVVKGIDNLRVYLKENEDVFVKISKWRGCFDGETEILSERGWVRFEDLLEDDRVATMDLDTREMTFVRPTAHIRYRHKGEMIKIKGRKIDALVTPNHRFWVTSAREGVSWSYDAAEDIMETPRRFLPATCNWKGGTVDIYRIENRHDDFRHVMREKNQARDLPIGDFLELLGWFVSEGCTTMSGVGKHAHRITISQSAVANPTNHARIYDLLVRLGYNPQREGDVGWSIFDKSLWLTLNELCYGGAVCEYCGRTRCSHTKTIPQFIYNLTPELIRRFLESLWLGDGSSYQNPGRKRLQISYNTSSKFLADGLQALLYRTGHPSRIHSRWRNPRQIGGRETRQRAPAYVVTVHTIDNISVSPSNFSRVEYDGDVFDVTVEPHHTILVRRNGISYWSGNSFESFHAKNYRVVEDKLNMIAHELGPLGKITEFIVEKSLPDRIEIGVDCWTVDGKYPENYLAGVEVKDKSYCGKFLRAKDLPKPLITVNVSLAPIFERYGYRGPFSTEVRTNGPNDAYLIDMTCFSEDTEVLTDRGWKLFRDVGPGDLVSTLNMETREQVYQAPSCYIAKLFAGNMVRIQTRDGQVDCLVTPDHDILLLSEGFSQLTKAPAGKLSGEWYIPTGAHRVSKFNAATDVSREQYAGMVYCLTVPNGTLYVRRNGKPFWSGNCRLPSPPNEIYQEMYTNLAECVWGCANGEVVEPKPLKKFGAQLVINSTWTNEHWQPVYFPKEIRRYVKLINSMCLDGTHYVSPQNEGLDSIGGVVGFGDTAEEAGEQALEHAGQIEGPGIDFAKDAIQEALDAGKKAEEMGVKMF